MKLFYTIICVCIASVSALGQGSWTEDSLYSAALHRTRHFRIFVPPGIAGQLPAILLLHGYTGNYRDWPDHSHAAEYAVRDSMIVVSTDGENSWYVNSSVDSGAQFDDYFAKDIVPYILQHYRIDPRHVGIAGLSMGGYGALVIGLRHPDIFHFVGAMSGSLDVPFLIGDLEKNGRSYLRPSLEHTFGSDTTHWASLAPERLLQKLDSAAVPYLYLCNGIQDEFAGRLALYRAFADLARCRGLRYEYHETPGKHNWEYWAREIEPLLNRFHEVSRGK